MSGKVRGYDRGKIERFKLRKPIVFNGVTITEAIIEIDHINFGLNSKTKTLNKNKRSNFSLREVEQFLMLLDGEDLLAEDYSAMVSHFSLRVDCPVKGRFKGAQF